MDAAQARLLVPRQAPFLSRRSRNARGVLIGAAALAGAAAAGATALGVTAVAAAVVAGARSAKSLRGKVVLITGSSRGLGLALAEEFGRRGARSCSPPAIQRNWNAPGRFCLTMR